MNALSARTQARGLRTVRSLVWSWVLIAVLAACGQEQGAEVEQQVDLGTHSLHIRCVGRGAPAVVIDTGHGDVAAKWCLIQDQLAGDARVCTYDRAGYGRSEPGPMPRHSRRAASELKLLLETAGVPRPYVLVGHSLGGLNAQVFAGAYPERVAGLVLVDPPPVDFATGKAFPQLYQMLTGQAAELAAGQPNPAFGEQAAAFQQFWIEQNRELAPSQRRARSCWSRRAAIN